MRKGRFGLLAGSVLAVTVAAPTLSVSAPDRVESVLPPPPMLNGHRTIRRHAAPTPPPPAPVIRHHVTIRREEAPTPPPSAPAIRHRVTIHLDAAPLPLPMPAPAPVAKVQQPAEPHGINFKGALNKIMAA